MDYHEVEAGRAGEPVLIVAGAHSQDDVLQMLAAWAGFHDCSSPVSYIVGHGERAPWWREDWEERLWLHRTERPRVDIVH